jgi:hypothetical protein
VGCWISGKDGAAVIDGIDRGSVVVEAAVEIGTAIEQGG